MALGSSGRHVDVGDVRRSARLPPPKPNPISDKRDTDSPQHSKWRQKKPGKRVDAKVIFFKEASQVIFRVLFTQTFTYPVRGCRDLDDHPYKSAMVGEG